MSDVGVRKMIAKAKARGYVTYDELNKVLPSDKTSSEQIEDTMAMLNEMGINVIESEEAEEGEESGGALVPEGGSKALATTKTGEQYDRTDDPVRMYLREMGSVELLSREGEIAIAKRIEAGRELMIGALCESPLTFEALTVWRDELNEGKVLLRDIIDLEAMYGGGPEGAPTAPAEGGGPEGADGAAPAPIVFKPPEFRKPELPPEPPKPPRPSPPSARMASRCRSMAPRRPMVRTATISRTKATCRFRRWKRRSSPRCWRRWTPSPALQEAGQAAGCQASRRRFPAKTFRPARNAVSRSCATRPWTWSSRSSSITTASNSLLTRCTASTSAWPGLEGRLLRLAESQGVRSRRIPQAVFRHELDPNWARRVGRLSGLGLARFRHRGTRQDQVDPRRDSGPGARNAPVGFGIPPQRPDRAERASANPASPRRK